MKKSPVMMAGIVLAGMMAFSSCDKDDNESHEITAPVRHSVDWDSSNGMSLIVEGQKLNGSVYYTPDKEDVTKASLRVKGEMVSVQDFMDSLSLERNATKAVLTTATSNVIAGSSSIKIPITMRIDGGVGYFEGDGETDYCTYSYNGHVSEEELNLSFDNVLLKDQTLAGTEWTPRQPDENGNTIDITCSDTSSISRNLVELLDIIRPILQIDIDGTKLSFDQAFCETIHSIRFYGNGIWTIFYTIPLSNMVPVELPKSLFRYVITGSNSVRAFVNGAEVMKLNPLFEYLTFHSAVRSDALISYPSGIFSVAAGLIANHLNTGIPFTYTLSDDELRFTLSPDNVYQILSIVLPLLQDPEVQAELIESVSSNPRISQYAERIPVLLSSLPDEIEDDIMITLNFVR